MARTRQAIIGELGRALQAYQRSTQAFDDEVGRVLDLNPVDLRCLDWLTDGPMPASRLAEATGLSSAATTSMIDRLERKGFVRRVRHDTDRRQVLVEHQRGRAGADLGDLRAARRPARLFARFDKAALEAMLENLVAMRGDATQNATDSRGQPGDLDPVVTRRPRPRSRRSARTGAYHPHPWTTCSTCSTTRSPATASGRARHPPRRRVDRAVELSRARRRAGSPPGACGRSARAG